jgi:PadR family transcriptional regulator PadR
LTYEEEYMGKRVRKYYVLTTRGKSEKVRYLEELKDFMATLNKIISPQFM